MSRLLTAQTLSTFFNNHSLYLITQLPPTSQLNNSMNFYFNISKIKLIVYLATVLATPIPPHTHTLFPIILMISTFLHTAVQARKLRTVQIPPVLLFSHRLFIPLLTSYPSHATSLLSLILINFRSIFLLPIPHCQCPGSSFHISHLDSSNYPTTGGLCSILVPSCHH